MRHAPSCFPPLDVLSFYCLRCVLWVTVLLFATPYGQDPRLYCRLLSQSASLCCSRASCWAHSICHPTCPFLRIYLYHFAITCLRPPNFASGYTCPMSTVTHPSPPPPPPGRVLFFPALSPLCQFFLVSVCASFLVAVIRSPAWVVLPDLCSAKSHLFPLYVYSRACMLFSRPLALRVRSYFPPHPPNFCGRQSFPAADMLALSPTGGVDWQVLWRSVRYSRLFFWSSSPGDTLPHPYAVSRPFSHLCSEPPLTRHSLVHCFYHCAPLTPPPLLALSCISLVLRSRLSVLHAAATHSYLPVPPISPSRTLRRC